MKRPIGPPAEAIEAGDCVLGKVYARVVILPRKDRRPWPVMGRYTPIGDRAPTGGNTVRRVVFQAVGRGHTLECDFDDPFVEIGPTPLHPPEPPEGGTPPARAEDGHP